MRLAEFLHKITSRHVKPEGLNENLPESSFPDAVKEAQVLLHFASRRGIQLEDTIIKKAVDGAHIAVGESRDIKATKQIEQEFWPAFQQLAQAVKTGYHRKYQSYPRQFFNRQKTALVVVQPETPVPVVSPKVQCVCHHYVGRGNRYSDVLGGWSIGHE